MTLKNMLDRGLSAGLAVTMGLLVIDVVWQVASRYLLKQPSSLTDEIARYLMIWMALFGAAWVSGQRGHLAIDLLSDRLSAKHRFLLNQGIQCLMLIFAFCVMVVGGGRLVYVTLTLNQLSPALQIPLGYIYLALPLSGACIVTYCLIQLVTAHTGAER